MGADRGPDVEKYQAIVGLRPGDPWCAAFVSWCWVEANALKSAPGWCSGSAITLWHRGARRLSFADRVTPLVADHETLVRPGMVWVRAKSPAGADSARRGTWVQGHCGVVVATDAEGFVTIEGNTDGGGSRA